MNGTGKRRGLPCEHAGRWTLWVLRKDHWRFDWPMLRSFTNRMTRQNRKRRAVFIRFKISPPLVPLVLRSALAGIDQCRNCRCLPQHSPFKPSRCPGNTEVLVPQADSCSQSSRLRRIASDLAKGIRWAEFQGLKLL